MVGTNDAGTMERGPWSPAQYDRFRDERSRPFFDLLALVKREPEMRVVDLGCGTGALTAQMHDALGAKETLGIDSSPAMLEKAREHAKPGLRFEQGTIEGYAERGARDLVLSNAAIHWVEDHEALLARLAGALGDHGQMAVQVPASFDAVWHTTAKEVAREAVFRDPLGGYESHAGVYAPQDYARILYRLGFREQHARLQVYAHELASRDEVVEWNKGTTLTEYQRRLPADVFARFVARYTELLLPKLEDTRPHLYLFKRILFWGRK
jgi:trans-aconitate 2-methyltransferase